MITNAGSYVGILLSIGVFASTPSWCQPVDSIGQSIQDQLAEIEADYYYSDLEKALQGYQQVANQAAQQARWELHLTAIMQAAWCADYHGDVDTLQYYLKHATQVATQHAPALDTLDPQHSVRMMIPYTEGIFYYATEDYLQSVEAFSEVVSPNSPAFDYDSMMVFSTYSYIGQAHYENANYTQAAAYHQRAIQWLPPSAFQQNSRDYYYYQSLNYLYLGQCYLSEAQYEKRPEYYQVAHQKFLVALSILRRHLNDASYQHSLSSAYEQLANWHRLQQNYDSALWYSNVALSFYDEASRQEGYRYTGQIYKSMGDYPKALDYFTKSLDGLATDQEVKMAACYLDIGNVYALQKHWDSAISSYQQSLSTLIRNFDPESMYENPSFSPSDVRLQLLSVLMDKANALAEKSKSTPQDTISLLAAIETYRLAVLAIDQMRQTFPSLEYKQFISAEAASLYEQAIQASLRAHELGLSQKDFLAEAFFFSEKGKAMTLLEAVKTNEARSFADIPPELLEQENELKRELTYWENQLYQAQEDSAQRVLRNRSFETREAYNALVKRLEEEYPNYYRLKYDTDVVGLTQLQSQLPENAVLLSFSYGDGALYTFTVRRNAVQYRTLRLDSLFHRQLENILHTVSQYDYASADDPPTFRQFTEDAHQLYQSLIQPSLSTSPTSEEHLIIIPDGLLGYLPFDVLLTEATTGTKINYARLPYLVKQVPISYEYSATLLSNVVDTKPEASYPYLGFAPSYQEAPLAQSREVRTTLDGQLLGLEQLRYNQEEVSFVSGLFGGTTFTGDAATEAEFKQRAGQSALLHLSMHAYAHDKNDDFSGLIFTQQADTGREDGFLHSNELYNLSLNAELAVLSACKTGIGTLAPGEGIMSLGRAFKYAGCPNVTMSLWKADDQSTSGIMQQFFTHLHDGAPKDDALREAKLDYLNQAKSAQAHPYYWAAFVQVGDTNPLSEAGTPAWWWIAGGVVMALLIIGIVVYRSTR